MAHDRAIRCEAYDGVPNANGLKACVRHVQGQGTLNGVAAINRDAEKSELRQLVRHKMNRALRHPISPPRGAKRHALGCKDFTDVRDRKRLGWLNGDAEIARP